MKPVFYNHAFLQTDAITHGFFSRVGGVSSGLYKSLNCGAGSYDNQQHIAENRRRVMAVLGMPQAPLCSVYQVHSPNVVIVNEPFTGIGPQADAMVTDQPRIALGILTADCAPVMFADRRANVIGIAHAGWKGAYGGVLENTIEAMERLGADRQHISAVIGPTIAQSSYEVGPEFRDRFAPAEQEELFLRSRRADHFMFDLPGYVMRRLRQTQIKRIAVITKDTCADPEHFFSYRRATLNDEPDYGRQISVIGLKS